MPIIMLFFRKIEEQRMISKTKLEKFLAFTLAEVLITMMVIVLMTLASIPVIKHSKELREASQDKNTWMAMYDANGDLQVFVDGVPDASLVGSEVVNGQVQQYAKFVPPAGVTRFNVTVVGGGGGGAAGMSSTGQSKVFFPDSTDNSFVPASEGIYQIVAIGGGGGGGGGGVGCDGGGGYTGGAVIAQAKLSPNEVYTAVAGPGGAGGQAQKAINVFLDIFVPVAWIGVAAAGVLTGGIAAGLFGSAMATWAGTTAGTGILLGANALQALEASVTTILAGNQPTDRMQGGGYGLNSAFAGINADGQQLTIVACGGGGGQHVRKKALWKCKGTGGQDGSAEYDAQALAALNGFEGISMDVASFASDLVNKVNNSLAQKFLEELGIETKQKNHAEGIIGSAIIQEPWKEDERKNKPNGYICRDNNGTQQCRGEVGTRLPVILKDMVPSQFGNGGLGGDYRKTGSAGQGGFVQVQEVAVYGGGGGQPGAVSFYSYTKSPLSTPQEKQDGYVKVFPGKGGQGGQENGADGADGMFSRFGSRIIADGGLGGDIRANGIDPESGSYEAKGEDGIASALPSNLQEIVKNAAGSGNFIEESLGGISHGKSSCKYEGLGAGNSCGAKTMAMPGMGGGGGGALGTGDFDWSKVQYGKGGNGASGIVLVTW